MITPSWLALYTHLCYNLYPPVSGNYIPVAEKAIELCNEGKWDDLVEIGKTEDSIMMMKAEDVSEWLHLDCFLNDPDDVLLFEEDEE